MLKKEADTKRWQRGGRDGGAAATGMAGPPRAAADVREGAASPVRPRQRRTATAATCGIR
jgi:hypothetical protein